MPLRLLLLAVGATGCVAIPLGGARTLDEGKWQVQVGQIATAFEGSGVHGDGEPFEMKQVYTNLDLGVLYGVTDRVELGARIHLFGDSQSSGTSGSVYAKFALLRAPGPESGVDLALAPSLGLAGFALSSTLGGNAGALGTSIHVPLLLGWNLSGGHQAIFGASVAYMYSGGSGEEAGAVAALASVGFSWKVVHGFRFVPQVAYGHLWDVLYHRPEGTQLETPFWMSQVAQVSLGLLLGGD